MLVEPVNHAFMLFEEILPVFIIAVIASSLIDTWIPEDSLEKLFPKHSEFLGVIYASFIGSLVPICTCGMIPLAINLHKKKLNWKVLTAFLVSGNACSIPALMLTVVLGYKLMWLRLLASIIFGILVTYIIALFVSKNFQLNLTPSCCHTDDHCHTEQEHLSTKKDIFAKILEDLFSMSINFLPWIIIAVLLASVLSTFSSSSFLLESIGKYGNPFISPLLASLVGFPFYFCAGADIPLSRELINMGVPLGTIISFMLASPGVNFTSLVVYKQAIGFKQAMVLISVSILSATLIGLVINFLL